MTTSAYGDAEHLQPPEQLQTVDRYYVPEQAYEVIAADLRSAHDGSPFTFLEVRGGKGAFTDRLLELFPQARGVVLDDADELLLTNSPNHRKALVLGSALEMDRLLDGRRFDAIFFNLSLHHFVGSSYRETRDLQRRALAVARGLLNETGFVSVVEDIYDGAVIDDLPSRLLFTLTSGNAPACFLSGRTWVREFERSGYAITRRELKRIVNRPLSQRLKLAALTVRSLHQEQFTLRPVARR